MTSSHSLDRLQVTFDSNHLISDAGLLLPSSLAQHLGLGPLIDSQVRLGRVAGAAHPGRKCLTLIASLLAGGDCIDDADALRAGGTAAVLGHEVAAPSTLGTFLRAFRIGHVRQLDQVSEELWRRAWKIGAGVEGDGELTVDLDSSVVETYGLKKQGGRDFTYQRTRGYHPLLAVLTNTNEVLHCRLRGGRANASRGSGHFVRQSLARLRRLRPTAKVVLRADSGFYSHKVVQACQRHQTQFSISVRLQPGHRKLIDTIEESSWNSIPYWMEGAADVAEIAYRPFQGEYTYRLIVRRVQPAPGTQLWLRGLNYSYYAFITDREGELLELEADHRRHAEVENVIRELKYDLGLNHMPSGKFAANAVWLALNAIAHNLGRWLDRLGQFGGRTLKSIRRRFLTIPARLVRSGRRNRLRYPTRWPWKQPFIQFLSRLRQLPIPLTT